MPGTYRISQAHTGQLVDKHRLKGKIKALRKQGQNHNLQLVSIIGADHGHWEYPKDERQ